MIREFSVHAKSTNKKAPMVFAACASLAFAFILMSMIIPSYRGVVSLLGMGLLVGAITVYTRYVSPEYYYDITFDSEGTPLLVVRQIIGKRHTTLCRIGLSEIVKIEQESAGERHRHKTPGGFVKFNYAPTLMPETTYRITTMSRYEKAEIIIEASEEFASLLRSYSAEARELMSAREENEEY